MWNLITFCFCDTRRKGIKGISLAEASFHSPDFLDVEWNMS